MKIVNASMHSAENMSTTSSSSLQHLFRIWQYG